MLKVPEMNACSQNSEAHFNGQACLPGKFQYDHLLNSKAFNGLHTLHLIATLAVSLFNF